MHDHYIDCRGLRIHAVERGEEHPRTVLLHHGFLDHARSWDPVAECLAEHYRVLALDARGHGDSDWLRGGGYYFFQDYVFDLADVIDHLVPGPVILVGHSMGGMVCSLFAGTFPDQALALVSIEGSGPPDSAPSVAPGRMGRWILGVRRAVTDFPASMASVEEAAERLRTNNPRLTEAFSRHLARHGTRKVSDGFQWKFDPVHRTRSPQPFYLEQARAFWLKITAPTLLVGGESSPLNQASSEDRECIPKASKKTIPDAGHMVHHDQPDKLCCSIMEFLNTASSP